MDGRPVNFSPSETKNLFAIRLIHLTFNQNMTIFGRPSAIFDGIRSQFVNKQCKFLGGSGVDVDVASFNVGLHWKPFELPCENFAEGHARPYGFGQHRIGFCKRMHASDQNLLCLSHCPPVG